MVQGIEECCVRALTRGSCYLRERVSKTHYYAFVWASFCTKLLNVTYHMTPLLEKEHFSERSRSPQWPDVEGSCGWTITHLKSALCLTKGCSLSLVGYGVGPPGVVFRRGETTGSSLWQRTARECAAVSRPGFP
eukprot:2163858-Amphidinium_carterae.1